MGLCFFQWGTQCFLQFESKRLQRAFGQKRSIKCHIFPKRGPKGLLLETNAGEWSPLVTLLPGEQGKSLKAIRLWEKRCGGDSGEWAGR